MLFYIISTITLFLLYNFVELNYFIQKKTKEIVSSKYIIVNKTKSCVLLFLTPLSFYYGVVFIGNFEIKNKLILDFIGGLYSSTDMSAMLYNRNTHISTWIHHIIVQLLYYYCYLNNYEMDYSLCRPICTYCCFSSMAYLVNYRLAIRFKNNEYEQIINDISFVIYTITSLINWLIQIYFLLGGVKINISERIVYIIILGCIINDDIYLMKFLYKTINLELYKNIETKLTLEKVNKIKIDHLFKKNDENKNIELN